MLVWFYKILLIIVSALLHQSHSNNASKCERINVSACQGLGYNTTSMPNFIGHKDQHEANFKVIFFAKLIEKKRNKEKRSEKFEKLRTFTL